MPQCFRAKILHMQSLLPLQHRHLQFLPLLQFLPPLQDPLRPAQQLLPHRRSLPQRPHLCLRHTLNHQHHSDQTHSPGSLLHPAHSIRRLPQPPPVPLNFLLPPTQQFLPRFPLCSPAQHRPALRSRFPMLMLCSSIWRQLFFSSCTPPSVDILYQLFYHHSS